MEVCEDIRHGIGMKDVYAQRKQTIERNFGTAKEHHAMRYTQLVGKGKMSMKIGLTFACLNMKKLARILAYREKQGQEIPVYSAISSLFIRLLSKKPLSLLYTDLKWLKETADQKQVDYESLIPIEENTQSEI